jgi:3'-phosphoadenosine 5'-phosphosulfate sulfotransferase (PAPS reductase)/FAD synthetase
MNINDYLPGIKRLSDEHLIKRLNISFSGGRSSAVMARMLKQWFAFEDTKIIVTFANTGCEHEDTLRFVNDCDREWGLDVVWLEAQVFHGERKGIRYKIVNYETASRNGEPFEEVIKKYGIPNQTNPHCTDKLKTTVMESYLKDQGFYKGKTKCNYYTAIGIRADECDRISARKEERKLCYPLVEWGWTKQKIIDYMKQFKFDLQLPEHLGNCTWCWKKSLRKHLTLAQDYPQVFNFPKLMDQKYGKHMAETAAGDGNGNRRFFRGHVSSNEILELAKKGDFKRFDDPNYDYLNDWDENLDRRSSCEESCEVYPAE